jgi:formylglycine-generating enzyme required for sulfatase activity
MNSQQYEQAVFISYAWGEESEEIVDQIDQALQQRGVTIIRDKRNLGYKGSISAFMERIGQGNCVIVVISDKYLRSPNCMFELVEIAEGKQFHDRIFPIILSNAEIYDPVRRLEYVKHWEMKRRELAQAMKEVDPANLQGIREDMDLYDRIRDKISGLTGVLKDMNTLTSDLHRDLDFGEVYAGIEKRMAQALGLLKAETGESPYMGLRFFDTSDAHLFYGRGALTDELLRRVQKESFLAVVGASGSGKSSVARAGLIPAWKAATMGTVHVITPSARPLESLAANLTRESESVTATSTFMDDLMQDARSLRLYVRKMLSGSGKSNLLFVVDQFEETFTLCKDPIERKAFIENLLSLANEENSAARVVITLRADFYHHCFEYEGLRLTFQKHQANIGPMTIDELREAIVQPAEKNGWDFQPGLVDLILQDVGTEPGALPLLSHALLETWKRRQGRTLTLQGYDEAGGVKKSIAQTAETVYNKLSPTEQTVARSIFLRLTELREGVQDTRRRVKMDELARPKEQEAVAKVLQILTNARLVMTEDDSAEVAHEALIREWGSLRKWLDEDRENLRLHRQLTERAREWQRLGREASELYRGTRLTQLQKWMKERGDSLSPLEVEFVKASLKRENRSRLATLGLRLAAFGSVGVTLFLLGVLGTSAFSRVIYRPLAMEWVPIPAGEFRMGSTDEEINFAEELPNDLTDEGQSNTNGIFIVSRYILNNEQPEHIVYLDTYKISRYETTNKQYYQCVRAQVCAPSTNNTYYNPAFHNIPVTGVNWEQARKFCEWNGALLPTEAQWEKAARATPNQESRIYPWGNDLPDSENPLANVVGLDKGGSAMPVGSFPEGDSAYGVSDMAGNVWEWVRDWYSEDYYLEPASSLPNPQGPKEGNTHTVRGGSFDNDWVNARSSYRSDSFRLGDASFDLGFRCVIENSP